MPQSLDQIKSTLDALSPRDRAELAKHLLKSLEPDDAVAPDEWENEIRRRVAEVRSGKAKGRSAADVFAESRERYP